MSAAPRARLLASGIALLALLATAPVLAQEPGSFEAAAMVQEIGAPKNPGYVHLNELESVEAVKFKRAPELQVSELGGEPIRLDPKKTYLWAIDRAGKLYVAPIENRKDGTESIGHTMLIGGRPARLAGELAYEKAQKGRPARWIVNNDSGRYSNGHAEVRRRHLKAAQRVIEAIGLEGPGKRELKTDTEFHEPDRFERRQSKKKRTEGRKSFLMKKLGGYLLRPAHGTERLPAKYRSTSARLKWARRAREKIGLPTRADWRRRVRSRAGEGAVRQRAPGAGPAKQRERARPRSRARHRSGRARGRR